MTTLLTSVNISANISAYISQRSGESDDAGNDRVLYKEMNWALRNDDKCLHDWATYVALLFFGGELDYSAAVCPPDALPKTSQVTSQ